MSSGDRLILASASPRRLELLRSIGLDPEVIPSAVEERREQGEAPEDYVRRLAREKAAEVAARNPGRWVLAADTVVVLGEQILEKPRDRTDAIAMLSTLSGTEHIVFTGVCLLSEATGFEATEVETTAVRMAHMKRDRIEWYVDTGEPMDKAGSYAIQGLGAMLVDSITGNYSNVVGLPLPAVERMMRRAGISPAGG